MKYKTKRELIKARHAFKAGDWKKGTMLADKARDIEDGPNLSYKDLRAIARLRIEKRKLTRWIYKNILCHIIK